MRPGPGHPLLKAGILAALVAATPLVLLPGTPAQATEPLHVQAPPSGPIIAFGDSYTSGWGTSPGHDYPTHLALLLDRPIVNAGKPGDTAADGLARMEHDVLARDPSLVIIAFGANDALQGLPQNDTLATIEQIVAAVRGNGTQVVLVGVRQNDYQDGFEQGLRDIALRHGARFVPDIMREVHAERGLRSDDIHPNDEGARVMAERVVPAVRAALGPV